MNIFNEIGASIETKVKKDYIDKINAYKIYSNLYEGDVDSHIKFTENPLAP